MLIVNKFRKVVETIYFLLFLMIFHSINFQPTIEKKN